MTPTPFELAGFEPIRRIGGGGFGHVWLARQTSIGREVAIKVGHTPLEDNTRKMRFDRECIALGRLSGHPNIIEVYTAGLLNDGRPYLVLEYVSGGTLWERAQREPIGEPELITIGKQLTDALNTAHTAGVMHRDMKPENVLLRANGDAVLGDFGIARLHDGANTTSPSITASLAFAAPESLMGRQPTEATDIYGIGICLLASATRRVPFHLASDESIHPVLNRVLSDPPPQLGPLGYSDRFNQLVHNLLEKDPAGRPQSTAAVLRRLENFSRPGRSSSIKPSVTSSNPPAVHNFVFDSDDSNQGDSNYYDDETELVIPAQAGGLLHSPGPDNAGGDAALGVDPNGNRFGGRVGHLGEYPSSSSPAVLAVGGLIAVAALALAIVMLLPGLRDSGDDTTVSVAETSAGPTSATQTYNDSEKANTGDEPWGSASNPNPEPHPSQLGLPLEIGDLGFDSNSAIVTDLAGPDAVQFCGNTPNTTGMTVWDGMTVTNGATSNPTFFQELVKFDSPGSAQAFVESYVGTADCESWSVGESGHDVVLEIAHSEPEAIYGDETYIIELKSSESSVPIESKVAVVRSGDTVYLISVFALGQDAKVDLYKLLDLAMKRLDF